MTNKLTLSQVEQIIDNHLESETNFMFVCDFPLAHYIYDYLHNDYGIKAESLELSTEIDEYYFSVTFYKDNEICLICENAKCENGDYKFDDNCDWIDYFIFTDMDKNLVNEKLEGKGSKSFFELVEDEEDYIEDTNVDNTDVCDECFQCVGCDEHCGRGNHDEEYFEEDDNENGKEDLCFCEECQQEREQDILDSLFTMLFDENACRNCVINKVIDTVYEFKKLGYLEARAEIKEFLED